MNIYFLGDTLGTDPNLIITALTIKPSAGETLKQVFSCNSKMNVLALHCLIIMNKLEFSL
jgi:hypothetical protein